ncbi:MAG: B12-binding domain-containing radical SAM protein [Chloroflexi bacterium]|nr:B12-binding domain-containing radical SAM protein [Chloroflexota bacterium]
MRVLLVPPKNNYPIASPSLDIPGQGFPYIAGALRRAGHEVHGLNLNYLHHSDSAESTLVTSLRRAIKEYQPDLIGLGGLSGDHAFVRDAMLAARRLAPSTPIVSGGGIITYDQHYVFTDLRPDFALYGEAEKTIVQLADALQHDTDISHIPNLAYWERGRPVYTTISPSDSALEDLAMPDYDAFDIEGFFDGLKYANTLFGHTRRQPKVMPITLGRSCPFKCTFCCHTTGPKYRQRSIESAMKEIAYFYDRYAFNILFIYDELFSIDEDRVREFCARVMELKTQSNMDFDWTCDLRVTHVNASVLKEMKAAGCIFIGYGLESASPTVLRSMKKGITVEQMERAIRLTEEAGIGVQGNFIFGDPAETAETIQETMSFFYERCRDAMIHLNYITPYPGSEIFQYCLDNGIIPSRQQYYERIGWIGKHKINMTRMPDNQFFGLVNSIVSVTDPTNHHLLGLKQTKALSCEQVSVCEPDKDMPTPSPLRVLEIQAVCPHCGEPNSNSLERSNPLEAGLVRTYCRQCHKRFNIEVRAETLESFAEDAQPRLVQANYKGFNIVRYDSRYYALSQSLGPTDLATTSQAAAATYRAMRKWFESDSVQDVRHQIDSN